MKKGEKKEKVLPMQLVTFEEVGLSKNMFVTVGQLYLRKKQFIECIIMSYKNIQNNNFALES